MLSKRVERIIELTLPDVPVESLQDETSEYDVEITCSACQKDYHLNYLTVEGYNSDKTLYCPYCNHHEDTISAFGSLNIVTSDTVSNILELLSHLEPS